MTVFNLLNPFAWFGVSGQAKLSGGNQPGAWSFSSAAGQAVTPDAALRLSAYWACVKIIAQTIGSLPFELFETSADGSYKQATANSLYDVLRHQPCADFDAVEFWEGVGANLAVWGNSYALKSYALRGQPGERITALQPLKPYCMTVLRTSTGALTYRYADPSVPQVDYAEADIFHIRGFGFSDVVGLSPIGAQSQFLGSAIATDEMVSSLFRNGMRMSGWFRYKQPGVLTQEQRADVRKALIEPFSGSGNAGKVGVLPSDFDWLATNMNPADAQLLDNRRMNVEEVCRAFGVPPVLVQHFAAGQTMYGAGVEHIVLAFMTTSLRPYLRRIEAAVSRQLLGRLGRQQFVARFDVEELLRGDNKGMADTNSQLVNNGIKTRNEVRRASYNLPPIIGGDDLTVQTALIPIGLLGEVAKLPKDKAVTPGADLNDGGGQKGLRPFDERKAFDEARHPRDADGRFSTAGALVDLFEKAVASRAHEGEVAFGRVAGARFNEAAGRDVEGWSFSADAQYLRHVRNKHGPESGDRDPIVAEDLRQLPIVAERGRVTQGGRTKHQALQTLITTHEVEGKILRAVWAVRPRKRRLTLQTFYRG